jgi:hypothetical protein
VYSRYVIGLTDLELRYNYDLRIIPASGVLTLRYAMIASEPAMMMEDL